MQITKNLSVFCRNGDSTPEFLILLKETERHFYLAAFDVHLDKVTSLDTLDLEKVAVLYGYIQVIRRLGPTLSEKITNNSPDAARVGQRMYVCANSVRLLIQEITWINEAIQGRRG